MQRRARIIGMVGALAVAAFFFFFVALLAPDTRSWSVGMVIAYIVAAAIVLLAPRAWACGAAIVTAVVTGLFALLAAGTYLPDTLILGAASLAEAWAAWTLVKHPD